MASHILAPYWAVKHRRERDYQFFKGLNPPIVKIMDGGPPDYKWAKDNLPGAILVARDWLLDDNNGNEWQALLRDPIGTGKRHANEWKAKQAQLGFDPANTFVQPLNEPKVWENNHQAVKPTVDYTIAFLDECKRLGLRGGALALSVGWPRNAGPDQPPLWNEYAGVEEAIKRGNHCLMLHEYWPRSGPATGWGWLAGRALKCPWRVPILIGECGMSYAVEQGGVPTAEQGWRRHLTPRQYAEQLVDYHNRMAVDSRFIGLCVFLCDFASPEWWSKDLEPAYDEVLARKSQLKPVATTPPPVEPPPVEPPPVQPPPAGASWRWPLDKVEFTHYWAVPQETGFKRRKSSTGTDTYTAHEGLDFRAAVGTPIYAVADGTVAIVATDTNDAGQVKGYGNYIRIRHGSNGRLWDSFYAHMREKSTLKNGATVKKGQLLGYSGNTGNSNGAHLHFEVRLVRPDGTWETDAPGAIYNGCVDPVTFFEAFDRAVAGGAPPSNPFRLADYI